MPSSSSLVRINNRSHRVLQDLAKREKASMSDVLDEAIEQYRRRKFLEELNADFAALRRDRRAWNQEQKERAVWDGALADGAAGDK